MMKIVNIALFSFISTLYLIPLTIWLSIKINAFDIPDNRLKPHTAAISNLGGLAVFGGFASGLLLSSLFGLMNSAYMVKIISISFFMMGVGLIDDRYDIGEFKLIAQALSGVFIYFAGFHISFLSGELIKFISTIFIVILSCNSLNLIDGADGLAAGIVSIASFFFIVLFILSGSDEGVIVSLILLSSSAAFLIFNLSPAIIYLGNSGSLFWGVVIAMMMMAYPSSMKISSLLAPVAIFAIPIADTTLSFCRRVMNGRSVFKGDRNHFYDHFMKNGFSLKKMITIVYLTCILFGICAIFISLVQPISGIMIFVSIVLFLFVIIIRMRLYQIFD